MSAARRGWLAGLAALLAGALALRVWGIDHGLPFVYNADENAHFVARAIGMFGHSYNPGYFINPPGFTYLIHAVFALRWGSREAVGTAFATDPTDAYVIARTVSALLGTAAVGLLAWAGARMFDRATGLIAGLVFAVAYLPVFYGHFALNDVPTLAPVCLALLGAAGVLRTGRLPWFAVAGAGIGLGAATKYTGGLTVLCLLAAAAVAEQASVRRRVLGVVLAGAVALGAFLVANPFALLDFEAFRDGLTKQSETAAEAGSKLGLGDESGLAYYLRSLTWGLGWVPALAALGGAVALALRDRRAALVLLPAPLLFALFMGSQGRFFARWLLPVYPVLALLAAVGARQLATMLAGRVRPAWTLAAAALVLAAQGALHSVHGSAVMARADTRQLARDWMVEHVPEGAKVVVEPVFPDQWASDPGRPSAVTGNGNRWRKWPTSRSQVNNDGTLRKGPGRVVKLEDYERTTRPELVQAYLRGGYCWVVTGSTQYGRAYADPGEVPQALRYYAALKRAGDVVFRASPWKPGATGPRFSFDFSFNTYPLAYARPGPEIVVYRLRGGRCSGRALPSRET